MTLIAAEMRARLSAEQNHRCAYCGSEFGTGQAAMTVDHVRPRSGGGGNRWDNLVAACLRCNGLRGSMNAWQFYNSRRWLTLTLREQGLVCPDFTPRGTERATLAAVWPRQARA